METPYDWITVGIFAGLVVLFMQRSTSDEVQHENDHLDGILTIDRAVTTRHIIKASEVDDAEDEIDRG